MAKNKLTINKRAKNQILLLVLIAAFLIVFGIITKGKIFRTANIMSISASMIYIILGGYGMMFVFGSGLIDLSIGANILMSAAVGGFVGQKVGGVLGLILFAIVTVICAIIFGQISVQNITYYRGIPLSMINYFKVSVDGNEVPAENIRVAFDDEDWFTLDEIKTIATIKWEYGTPAVVRVLSDGGLAKGEHDVQLTVCTRTAYIPVPLEGKMTRKVVIE